MSREQESDSGAQAAQDDIAVGVSSCLLGQEVRYDAGHKHDRYITDVLGRFVRFVPVCPEVEVGMGVPRETVRLVRSKDETRMIAPASGTDHTRAMRVYARRRVAEISKLNLSGYILKKGSPSCGMERVRVYTDNGMPSSSGSGLFAEALTAALPLLPVEEEGRLNDPVLRESFVIRVFAYHRLTRLFAGRWKASDLVGFQAAEKLLVMAHDPRAQKELGRIVAATRELGHARTRDEYRNLFMRALARPATRKRHTNALQHMLGYFKKTLGSAERADIADVIDRYHDGTIPLIVPITLLRHHVKVHRVDYLVGQTYLEPHPAELMLRNHA